MEDVLNLQLVGSLFGAGSAVADLIMDYLAMLKVAKPEKSVPIKGILMDMENVKQMSSRFSLKSFKIWLKPILKPNFQLLLENTICEVNLFASEQISAFDLV